MAERRRSSAAAACSAARVLQSRPSSKWPCRNRPPPRRARAPHGSSSRRPLRNVQCFEPARVPAERFGVASARSHRIPSFRISRACAARPRLSRAPPVCLVGLLVPAVSSQRRRATRRCGDLGGGSSEVVGCGERALEELCRDDVCEHRCAQSPAATEYRQAFSWSSASAEVEREDGASSPRLSAARCSSAVARRPWISRRRRKERPSYAAVRKRSWRKRSESFPPRPRTRQTAPALEVADASRRPPGRPPAGRARTGGPSTDA